MTNYNQISNYLVDVHTERINKIRIISARKSTKYERK
ncbi:MAG: BrnT family toxin [Candidatus Scalindua sp. AMX11]|nr:BrnT family toxin [Planctomycetota bacterium]RZV60355.1 MAG: BrnT family toxin [Candidatus Scalindua sp. SCAELEC01]TDE63097.1 MAG: BrnT family toxin [Candidatus Scalindua sp. AMX11]